MDRQTQIEKREREKIKNIHREGQSNASGAWNVIFLGIFAKFAVFVN